ncbi:Beta-fructofuranosidase, insoluble isoenzyme 7 [Apostasia shenzhenica]|uniref:Beta-fructofuranosidase, insoluble isoenzyme 7 n=1 Tax=Apostasia shenzhenica TaxID=1088818 RepID=A0A2I0BC83_9ASPA|nr:Beta-fructofuranosidase, insoluble isoenzyme 7 [Apostasia shenzhenica]
MASRWLFPFLLCLPVLGKDEIETHGSSLPTRSSEDSFPLTSKQYRTAFHFQPPENWLNDPNGPVLHNGVYHIFYQYNPYSAEWANITWGHSISSDLVNWTPLPIALWPSEPFDIHGCWSGSATILSGGTPTILYTGIDLNGNSVQNIAFPKNPSDPFLREWVKPHYNPVMVPDGFNATQFRDPATGWMGKDGLWRTVVCAEDFERRAWILLYRSEDFVHWTRAEKPLFRTKTSTMVECVDFFPVSVKGKNGLDTSTMDSEEVKHVLKFGLFDYLHDYYLIGKYLDDEDEFVPENISGDDHRSWPRYDYGSFYASKSFFDAEKKRRISWAWVNESDTIPDDVAKGWAGVLIVPRTVWLGEDGKILQQWPVKELESLRRDLVEIKEVEINEGEVFSVLVNNPSQADVEVEFELSELEQAQLINSKWHLDDAQTACNELGASVPGAIGPFGLLVLASHDLEEHTAIFFRVFRTPNGHAVLMCSDQRRLHRYHLPEIFLYEGNYIHIP